MVTHLKQKQKQMSPDDIKWKKNTYSVVWPNKPEEEQSHHYLAISTFLSTTSHGRLATEVVKSSPIIMFFHLHL